MAQDNLTALIDDIVSSRGAAAVDTEQFCAAWPAVKQGLELLAKLFPKAALVVGIVIAIGDRVCPK
jgi:hypothetical protein